MFDRKSRKTVSHHPATIHTSNPSPYVAFSVLGGLLLTGLISGCDGGGETAATDVLDSPDSIFADADLNSLVSVNQNNPANSSNAQLDLDLLSPQHFLAVLIEGKQLREYFDARDIDIDQKLLEPKPAEISLQDVQSILFMLDDSMLQNAMGGRIEKGWAVQIDFSKTVDTKAWQNWLLGPTAHESNIGDKTALLADDESVGVMWLTDSKAVMGSKDELQAIQKRIGQPISTQLASRIRNQFNNEFIFLGVQAAPLRRLIESFEQAMASFGGGDERMQKLFAGGKALESIQAKINLEGDNLGQLQLEFADEAAAKSIQSIVKDGINQMATMAAPSEQNSPGAPNNPAAGISQELRSLMEEIQKDLANGGLSTSQDEKLVSVQLNRPARFDELIDQSLASWQTGKALLYRSRKAGALSVALQKFQAEHGRLPAASASPLIYDQQNKDSVNEDTPQFSWRVAILPQLGYQELYDAFDFNQPWDSPANKKAASQMPAVFSWLEMPENGQSDLISSEADLPESDFQMLTGAAAEAGDAEIFVPTDVSDNPDRTLLIHQTPQMSSVWTKPDAGWEIESAEDFSKITFAEKQPVLAIMYSGRVVAITPEMEQADWFGWITPAGKEKVNRNALKQATIFEPMKEVK